MIRSLILFLALTLACAHAQQVADCSSGKGSTVRTLANGFVLRIAPAPASDKMLDADGKSWGCVASVTTPSGKRVFREKDHTITLMQVGNLGGPESATSFLLEAFSGGAHCCWRYFFVATGKSPGQFAGLENQSPVALQPSSYEGLNLWSNDGAFDYFDGLCHACAPRVAVYIILRGTRLINASESHAADYDRDIADARKHLDPAKLANFRAVATYDDSARAAFTDTIPLVLNITLAYLYSGREAEGWKTLDEMWPPTDAPRIKKLILETKAKGLTSILHDPHKMK